MIKKDYKKGDRVASTSMGYYAGVAGTVVRKAQGQHNMITRYVVELDIGKRIILDKFNMKLIEE